MHSIDAYLDPIKERILADIDARADYATSVFRDFVRIPSIYKDVAALRRASEFLADVLNSSGVEAKLIESGTPGKSSVLGQIRGKRPEQGHSLILNGHMDIYPPSKAWSMDPYGGVVRDGRLYGGGADDMKGGIVAMALAVSCLARNRIPLCGDLFLHAIPNHYNGGDGTRTALDSGLRADFAIVGEPSDLKIAIAQCGILYVNITVTGVPTHVTSQNLGVHPVPHAARLVESLRAIEFPPPEQDPLGGVCHLNISAMHAEGSHRSLVPEECTLTGDIRFTPALGREGAYRAVEEIVERHRSADPRLKIALAIDPTCIRNPRNATAVAIDAPIAQILSKAVVAVSGSPAGLICHPAWPDTPVFNEMGVQAVTFGPGSTACYWPEEHVEIADFLSAIKIYALTALDTCRVID